MIEANPIAAYLIRSTQSPLLLACFKGLSVLIYVSVLFKLRAHRAGEVAAWFALAILAMMSVMWHSISRQLNDPHHVIIAQTSMAGDERLGMP